MNTSSSTTQLALQISPPHEYVLGKPGNDTAHRYNRHPTAPVRHPDIDNVARSLSNKRDMRPSLAYFVGPRLRRDPARLLAPLAGARDLDSDGDSRSTHSGTAINMEIAVAEVIAMRTRMGMTSAL
ncbi:hypothetical protein FN846DRAFT_901808 [Sphaerosporella brunnea]|uniref:Uncharacterized protein n=1 Tax=Sphaerosporella brunnea TaxID=1250544 RepID=A0A5J5FBH8_9PEZI|nr:hypothetical protein FN846DRAFT_901808 [Sphaerosporella brunnea]